MIQMLSGPAPSPEKAADAGAADREAESDQSHRVLVVEDDAGIRSGLYDLLVDLGYVVLCAENGQHAMDILTHSQPAPSVILLDLMMPVMDGWEFRIRQRADARLSKISVLAISADGSAKAEAIDADGFLHKPFRAADVQRELVRILERRERQEHGQSLMAMGTVMASVAHELKNPLTFILGNMELVSRSLVRMNGELASLRTAVPPCAPLCDALQSELADLERSREEARVGLDRIVSITQDMGLLGRRPEFRREPLALRSSIESAIRLTAPQIQRHATLVREYDDDPMVMGDWPRLTQVFLNLLVNATQAVSEAGERGEIRVRVSCHGDEVVTEVADTGVGFSSETAAHIFQPFFSTKRAGEGSGLGLTISREIISAHGGRIEYASRLGQGSRFRVTLPAMTSELLEASRQ
jgi:two-component system, NtrC family, sensor kinase